MAVYQSRFVFSLKGAKEVEIIDIDEGRVTGKFNIDGGVRHCEIRQNLLLIVTNKDNTDYFNFFVLNLEPTSNQPLITNRATYEKGKGDAYKLFNLLSSETPCYL